MAGSTRRSAILDSAVAEFSAHGYQGGRIERIAAAAGANKQLIFHYFGSKDGLYAAAVSALLPEAPEAADRRIASPIDSLKVSIATLAEQLQARPGIALAIAECSLGGDVPVAAARSVGDWLDGQREALRVIVEEGQRMGFFRDDIDAQSVADTALASLVGWAATAGGPVKEGRALGAQPVIAKALADYCAWR